MTEPDVTLTDYGLFAECAAFAWLIARRPTSLDALRRWIVLFFFSTAVAALLGGTVHGFFSTERDRLGDVLWKLSMIAVGGAALATAAMGARLLFARGGAGHIIPVAMVLALVYAAVILFVSDAFRVAVIGYVPAAALLFAAFLRRAAREPTRGAALGVWSLVLSFAAAAVQQLRIALHPVYFTHNALYHLVQGVALALLFLAFRHLLTSTGGLHADAA